MTDGKGDVLTDRPERAGEEILTLSALCEALLFVAGTAVSATDLARAAGVATGAIEAALDQLAVQLREQGRGVRLQHLTGSYSLVSIPAAGRAVARLLGLHRTERLSAAALETLAIVAYRGPVTRGEIEAIRGVDSGGVLQTLLAREMVEPVGRRTTVGSPIEYGVTVAFLRHFGLTSLADLAPLGTIDDRPVETIWDERLASARADEQARP